MLLEIECSCLNALFIEHTASEFASVKNSDQVLKDYGRMQHLNLRPFSDIFFLKKIVRRMYRAKTSMNANVGQLLVDLMNA
jgi:hypothetical protein